MRHQRSVNGETRYTAEELKAIVAAGRALEARGQRATCGEWIAHLEAKAELFDRIADDPATLFDPGEARRCARVARAQAKALRVEAGEWRWW